MNGHSAVSYVRLQPIVISGPSGGGKSTILSRAMGEYTDAFAFSVSHTTRRPREGERDGEHYYFVDRKAMEGMISNGDFYESAEFGGNLYGTSKKAVANIENSGKICILDVDLKGVRNFKANNFNAKYVLIAPPSIEVLEMRLRARGTETEDSLKKRLQHAKEDLKASQEEKLFDDVIVNDDLEKAYKEFLDIIGPGLHKFKN